MQKMGKFVVQCTENRIGDMIDWYKSVDIVYESEDGFAFVCECGDWDNETAQSVAALIVDKLQHSYPAHKLMGFHALKD